MSVAKNGSEEAAGRGGMNEWQLQEVLTSEWVTSGSVIRGERLFLAVWR